MDECLLQNKIGTKGQLISLVSAVQSIDTEENSNNSNTFPTLEGWRYKVPSLWFYNMYKYNTEGPNQRPSLSYTLTFPTIQLPSR